MSKGRGKGVPKLGDTAVDFIAQWNAAKPGEVNAAPKNSEREAVSDDAKSLDETLRSWKKGGAGVLVRKGVSTGYVKREKKSHEHKAAQCTRPVASQVKPSNLAPNPKIESVQAPRANSTRERLANVSADLRHLRITAAMSNARGTKELDPVLESPSGKLAILGLDFGTAFTKGVVRWGGRHYAVDWSSAVDGDDHHLLASTFSEGPDGRCVLGAVDAPNWSVHDGIKLKLLEKGVDLSNKERLAGAVTFIALAFRYVSSWLASRRLTEGLDIRWRLHIGLPTRSWDSDTTTEVFRVVAQAGRILALMPGPVSKSAAIEALGVTETVDRPAVDVLPEFACQLYSYLGSAERRDDLHALVDIGAGTLDVAYFNVFKREDEEFLPVFASEVERLGAHYLVAALSGQEGEFVWRDEESSLSDEQVAEKVGCAPADVGRRRSLYLSSVADVFNKATSEAMRTYPTSPAVQGRERLLLFLCGGGSRIDSIRARFDRIARESESLFRMRVQVSEIVRPRNIVGGAEVGFDRLSVAYGLSQIAADIGRVMRSSSLDPVLIRERTKGRDRDDDR